MTFVAAHILIVLTIYAPSYPTYLQMDAITRSDAEQLLASLVRTLVASPDEMRWDGSQPATLPAGRNAESLAPGLSDSMRYNERSLYMIPGTRQLVLLLRGMKGGLSASLCDLPEVPTVEEHTLFSCRSGVGDAFMNLVELVADYGPSSDPRVCNWSAPVLSTLPDSGSRTCATLLPGGKGVFLVGNQIDKGRDPVTLSVSLDGRVYDRHWAVRYGAPPVRYPGTAKGPGFQYPGAVVLADKGEMIVCYSVGKEDIALTRFSLSSLAL